MADSTPVLTNARQVAAMEFGFVEHTAFSTLVIGKRALVIAVGPPGGGKSTFAGILANSIPGPILYVSSEEQIKPSLARRLNRCGIRREDFYVLDHGSVDQIVEYVRQLKIVCLVIDSVTVIVWTAEELRHIIGLLPSLELLICTQQVTKAGLPAGSNSLLHEADIVLRVASMKWNLEKSRYQPLDTASGDVLPANIDPLTLTSIPLEVP